MEGLNVHAWREGGCVYGSSVRAWRKGVSVHMEGVKCSCMGRGCVHMEGVVCVCMGRGRVCMWKWWSVHAWGEVVYIGKVGVCVYGEREGVCI